KGSENATRRRSRYLTSGSLPEMRKAKVAIRSRLRRFRCARCGLIDRIALDTTPLSLLSHPKLSSPGVAEANRWLRLHLDAGAIVFIPEIGDYEVRREL